MVFEDVEKKSIKLMARQPVDKVELDFTILLNKIDELNHETTTWKKMYQKLEDEINRLKGEKGKPDIKPKSKEDGGGDKGGSGGKPPRPPGDRGKNKKKKELEAHEKRSVSPDKGSLPEDAQYKGSRRVIVQDVDFSVNNVEFTIHRYYSPHEGKTYEGELPPEYRTGSYGPGIRSFIIQFHYEARITQNVIHRILTGMGIQISEGEISSIIRDCRDFEREREEVRDEGIRRGTFQQIDDTGARLNGSNGYTIVNCNNFFTDYRTEDSKSRVAALKALTGGRVVFMLNDIALNYISMKVKNREIVKRLAELKSNRLYDEEALKDVLQTDWMRDALPIWVKYVMEGMTIGAYRENFSGPRTKILICDDAPQFKDILEYLGLCLIHEERHYKKLTPQHPDFIAAVEGFREEFWKFYSALKEYKKNPTDEERLRLDAWFDTLFAGETCYYALNRLMERTQSKKDELLLVLRFPEIPLHNNTSELAMREKVVQRKIRGYFRSMEGARASDVFLSLMSSCRKLGIAFGEYVKDRSYHLHKIPRLGEQVWSVPDPP